MIRIIDGPQVFRKNKSGARETKIGIWKTGVDGAPAPGFRDLRFPRGSMARYRRGSAPFSPMRLCWWVRACGYVTSGPGGRWRASAGDTARWDFGTGAQKAGSRKQIGGIHKTYVDGSPVPVFKNLCFTRRTLARRRRGSAPFYYIDVFVGGFMHMVMLCQGHMPLARHHRGYGA